MVLSHKKLKRKRREEMAALAASGASVAEMPDSVAPDEEVPKKTKRRKKAQKNVNDSAETGTDAEKRPPNSEDVRAPTVKEEKKKKKKKQKKRVEKSETGGLTRDDIAGEPLPSSSIENAVDVVEARTSAARDENGGQAEQPLAETNGASTGDKDMPMSVREKKGKKKKGGRDRWGEKIPGDVQANGSSSAEAAAAASKPSECKASDEEAYDLKKVYVGGMPYYTTEDDIHDYFAECGVISELDCLTFPDSGNFRGIVFITFKTEEGAANALTYDGSDMGGRFLKIEKCKLKPLLTSKDLDRGDVQRTPGYRSAYVGNLCWDITEDDIRNFLKSSYINSKIDSIRLTCDKITGDFKGFGHVDFGDDESLEAALKLNQKPLMGRPLKIAYAVAPKLNSVGKENGVNSSVNGNDSKRVVSCHICGEEGHKSFLCPKKGVNGGVRPESVKIAACYSCGEEGHMSFFCPKKGYAGTA